MPKQESGSEKGLASIKQRIRDAISRSLFPFQKKPESLPTHKPTTAEPPATLNRQLSSQFPEEKKFRNPPVDVQKPEKNLLTPEQHQRFNYLAERIFELTEEWNERKNKSTIDRSNRQNPTLFRGNLEIPNGVTSVVRHLNDNHGVEVVITQQYEEQNTAVLEFSDEYLEHRNLSSYQDINREYTIYKDDSGIVHVDIRKTFYQKNFARERQSSTGYLYEQDRQLPHLQFLESVFTGLELRLNGVEPLDSNVRAEMLMKFHSVYGIFYKDTEANIRALREAGLSEEEINFLKDILYYTMEKLANAPNE